MTIHSMNAYVWCRGGGGGGGGQKPVTHLKKFYLLQWEAAKVKSMMDRGVVVAIFSLLFPVFYFPIGYMGGHKDKQTRR